MVVRGGVHFSDFEQSINGSPLQGPLAWPLVYTTAAAYNASETNADLPSPFGQLATQLSDSDPRFTVYEIFVVACRTSTGKPLSYISNNSFSDSPTYHNSSTPNHNSPTLQRSLTSAAASKMKKALGLKSPGTGSNNTPGSGQGKVTKAMTVGELTKSQMRVSETVDSRVRRALLRISASQVSVILCFNYIFICSILVNLL